MLFFLGDSYAKSGCTDYEFLFENNLIDTKKINYFDFLVSINFYEKKDSIFKLSQDIKEKNSWPYRLSNLLKIEYKNLSMMGASWQLIFNQILYSILEYKNKEIIFIITPPINDRILINKHNKHDQTKNFANMDLYNMYEVEKNFNSDFLLNNYSFHYRENKLNTNIDDIFEKEEMENIYLLLNKKVFNIYNIHAIINILNLLINEKINFFFLPAWYENIKTQFEDIIDDKDFLDKFIFSKIKKEELMLDSPFLLKKLKKTPFSPHPSFHSQELLANYYFDFLKNKL